MPPSLDLDRPKRYFAIHYILLRFLGLGWWHHPDEGDNTNFPGLYLYYSIITELVWVVGFVGLESIDPFIGEKDLDRFMFSLSFVITHDLTLIKLYIFFFKNREIQDIVRTLEIDLQSFYQNNTKNRKTIKITLVMTASFVFFGWMTIGNVNVYGIYQDIIWKSEVEKLNDTDIRPFRTLPQPIYIPWNYQTDRSFIATFLLETVGLLWTGHIVMTIDTFIGSLILHMSSQFEILQEALITAYDRTIIKLSESLYERNTRENMSQIDSQDVNGDDFYESIVRQYCSNEEIESALEKTLKSCFQQHQLLIGIDLLVSFFYLVWRQPIFGPLLSTAQLRTAEAYSNTLQHYGLVEECVEKFARTYTYGFMTQLLSSMAAICVVMVQVSQDASSLKSIRIVTSLAFFVAMVIQLAIQCLSGNELTYQASKVSEAVMQSKWERMPPRIRKLLAMVMMRAQRPLHLTAAGFANINNDCFLSIMKAAYSYYAVLSQKQV